MRAGWILAALAALAAGATAAKPRIDYAAILADPIRPETDRGRDADPKPAGGGAFPGVRRDDRVAELARGGGFFPQTLPGVVGPAGIVYAVARQATPTLQAIAAARPNVKLAIGPT